MKTLLFGLILGLGVAGLRADDPSAVAGRALAAQLDAVIAKPLSGTSTTDDKILAEMKKQTELLKALQPTVLYDPAVKTVPVTQIPVR